MQKKPLLCYAFVGMCFALYTVDKSSVITEAPVNVWQMVGDPKQI